MKGYFTPLLVVFLCCTNCCLAQRIACINSDSINCIMPQYEYMLNEQDSMFAAFNHNGEHLMEQYEMRQKGLQCLDCFSNAPDSVINKEIEELQALQTKIEYYKDTCKVQIERAMQDRLRVINNIVLNAVKQVAMQQGYHYVLDNAKNSFYYFDSLPTDITDEVIKKLDCGKN